MYLNRRVGVKKKTAKKNIYKKYKNGVMLQFYSFCVMVAAVILNLISKVIHTADSIFGLYSSLLLIVTVHWQNLKTIAAVPILNHCHSHLALKKLKIKRYTYFGPPFLTSFSTACLSLTGV